MKEFVSLCEAEALMGYYIRMRKCDTNDLFKGRIRDDAFFECELESITFEKKNNLPIMIIKPKGHDPMHVRLP